jgi:hypothetical protein
MAAVDDLSELVERAAAAEKSALASKWKEESDVQGLIRRMRKAAEEQRQAVSLDTDLRRLSPRWAGLRQNYLDLGAQPALPGQEPSAQDSLDHESGGSPDDGGAQRLSHQAAAQAEQDARAAVGIARIALTDAALAVLQSRLARIQAGEDQPESATVEGHVPLHGRNPVSRHGPALAQGVTGEIKYVLTRKPRTTVRSLGIAVGLGLLYLGYLRVFQWDKNQQWLPYLGLWVISFVMGGAVCINAMSFDAMRVRAALDSGARLWHILVITVSYLIGYLVNLMLIWRVFAAQELAARLDSVVVPAILVVLSSAVMWLLLTVFAIALSQQPKIRRVLLREISDYASNAEARAFAEEDARTASTVPQAAGASVRKPSG